MRFACTDTLSGPTLISYPFSCPPFNETECIKVSLTYIQRVHAKTYNLFARAMTRINPENKFSMSSLNIFFCAFILSNVAITNVLHQLRFSDFFSHSAYCLRQIGGTVVSYMDGCCKTCKYFAALVVSLVLAAVGN